MQLFFFQANNSIVFNSINTNSNYVVVFASSTMLLNIIEVKKYCRCYYNTNKQNNYAKVNEIMDWLQIKKIV